MKYMLDANICIYIMKNSPAVVLDRFRQISANEICISPIVYGELIYGAEHSQRKAENLSKVELFSRMISVLPINHKIGLYYGQIRSYLNKNGTPIGNNDLWIAAHALAENLILITNNEREFSRIQNLRIENWISPCK